MVLNSSQRAGAHRILTQYELGVGGGKVAAGLMSGSLPDFRDGSHHEGLPAK